MSADRGAASHLAGQAGHKFPEPMTLRVARVWPVEAKDFWPTKTFLPSRAKQAAILGQMMAEGTFRLPENPTQALATFRLQVMEEAAIAEAKATLQAQQATPPVATQQEATTEPQKAPGKPRRKVRRGSVEKTYSTGYTAHQYMRREDHKSWGDRVFERAVGR